MERLCFLYIIFKPFHIATAITGHMNASIISVNHIVSQMFKNSEVPRVESRLTTRKAEMKAIETIASSLPFYFVDRFET
tara:strand:- start:470 stop:706 length:237 start_codon:yes stop_codon:yes gene_type:complete